MIVGAMKDICIYDAPVLASVTRLSNRLRCQMRDFDVKFVLENCLSLLSQNDRPDLDDFVKPLPWELLLIIKWLLTDSRYNETTRRIPSDYDARSFFGLLERCYAAVPPPVNELRWDIFWRKLAFQQFKFERRIERCDISRQSLIFGHLEPLHPIRRKFFELNKIELLTFIEFSFFLIGLFFNPENLVTSKAPFLPFEKYYPPESIERFFKLISGDLNSITDYLLELERRYAPRSDHQLFELSPLKRLPLLKEREEYRPYSKRLLHISVPHWIYDSLREYNAQWFGNEFGDVFEGYVEKLVNHLGLPCLTENQIESALGKKHKKLVDFIIMDCGSKIYVEAKGVEMTYLGQLSDNLEDIRRATDSSLIKGIKQGYSAAQSVKDLAEIDGIKLPVENEDYLIIVTYKELYIGNGRVFRDLMGESGMVQLRGRDGFDLIPMEHMYFMSIKELEILAQAVHEKKIGLQESLRKAVAADSAWNTRKLVFTQHLADEVWPDGIPEFLDDEFTEVFNRLRQVYKA